MVPFGKAVECDGCTYVQLKIHTKAKLRQHKFCFGSAYDRFSRWQSPTTFYW